MDRLAPQNPPPTCFSTRLTQNLELGRDRLTVAYRGLGQHETDLGTAIVSITYSFLGFQLRVLPKHENLFANTIFLLYFL